MGEFNISIDYLDVYSKTKDQMRYIAGSSVRVQILVCLGEGSKTMTELRSETGQSSSTLSHNLSNLEKKKITTKNGEKYSLTSFGKIISINLVEDIKTNAAISKFKRLWINHDMSSIPPELLRRIGDLHNSTLIEAESGEIFKPQDTYEKILTGSEYIKGISPIFRFNYIEMYQKVIERGTKVELILTQDIVNQTMEGISSEEMEYLKSFISQEMVKFWVIPEVKIAFTVTDKYLSLGLFLEQGDYDNNKDLISDDYDAVTWGNHLFEYHKNQAKPFTL